MKRCVIVHDEMIEYEDNDRTPAQVMEILRRSPNKFAQRLCEQFDARRGMYADRLSPKQWDWAYYLATKGRKQ